MMGTLRIGGFPYLNIFSETVPTFCFFSQSAQADAGRSSHIRPRSSLQFGNQLPLDQWFPKSVRQSACNNSGPPLDGFS